MNYNTDMDMNPSILKDWQLDLIFHIDFDALRPYNAYGLKAEDFKHRHHILWGNYGLPEEYEYIYSYIRLNDLSINHVSCLTYVKDLFYWEMS